MKSRYFGLVVVIIFSILFAIRQYQPGTWLMGWDSLHPEFNYELALSRVFGGAWRESQGLGAVAVHSHMSELPRIATLWVIDLFVPTSTVRWTYILLMLVLGVVGAYVLLVHILSRIRDRLGMWWVTMVAIVGSLAYLFNLSTLHHFLVPFEMFVVLFGLLPWSLWSVSRYFNSSNRVNLSMVIFIQFLLSSTAFAATLWIVYYGAFVITTWFLTKSKREWMRVQLVTHLTNCYWLLPTLYGLIATGQVVESAKINQMFSPEAWLNNVAYGTVSQVMRLESFILEWMNWERGSGVFGRVARQWVESGNMGYVGMVQNVVAGMVVLGLVRWGYMVLKKNREVRKWSGMVYVGLLLVIVMLSQVWPIGGVIEWARENVPLVGELLRTPFTKVSIPLQLVYAVLFGYFLMWIVERVKWPALRVVVILVVTGVIVYPFGGWITKGNLIGDVVVTTMPIEYEKLFEKSKELGIGRMVALPTPSMWGWEYRDWGNDEGYEGANFTQFGIVQPLLIRDFDRWSQYNESFYNELSSALYGEATERVNQVLNKYDVRYVLLDESVIAPGQDKEILRVEETKRIAEELGWEQKFKEGFLTVWEVNNSQITNDKSPNGKQWISTPETYTLAEGEVVKAREDVIFEDNGSYVSGIGGMQYPFANLMREEVPTAALAKAGEGSVEWGEGGVRIIANHKFSNSQMIIIPGWEVGEIVRVDFADGDPLPAYYVHGEPGPVFLGDEKPTDGKSYFYSKVSEGEEWREYRTEQKFEIRKEKLEIEVRGEPFVYDFAKQGQGSIGNCDVLKRGVAKKDGDKYVADSRGAVCDYVVMEAPFTRVPHLLRLRGENIEGRSIKFFLYNTGSKRNDIEYLLSGDRKSVNPYSREFDQTFALLPWEWDGYYTLNIETRSFGERAENRIEPVVGIYVPLEKIANAKIVNDRNSGLPVMNNANVKYVKKTGTWLYGLGVEGDGLIKLSQGYDKGWIGLLVESEKLKVIKLNHVKVDGWSNGWIVKVDPPSPTASEGRSGWANGWIIDKSQITNSQISNWEHGNQEARIVIIFYWPQLLQYLGFVMLIMTLIILISYDIQRYVSRRN